MFRYKRLQNSPHMTSLTCVTFTVKVNIPPTDDTYNWTSITLQKKRLPRRKLLKDAYDFVQNINVTERAEQFNQCVSCWCVGIDHDMCQLFLVNLIYGMQPDNFFVFVVFLRTVFFFLQRISRQLSSDDFRCSCRLSPSSRWAALTFAEDWRSGFWSVVLDQQII